MTKAEDGRAEGAGRCAACEHASHTGRCPEYGEAHDGVIVQCLCGTLFAPPPHEPSEDARARYRYGVREANARHGTTEPPRASDRCEMCPHAQHSGECPYVYEDATRCWCDHHPYPPRVSEAGEAPPWVPCPAAGHRVYATRDLAGHWCVPDECPACLNEQPPAPAAPESDDYEVFARIVFDHKTSKIRIEPPAPPAPVAPAGLTAERLRAIRYHVAAETAGHGVGCQDCGMIRDLLAVLERVTTVEQRARDCIAEQQQLLGLRERQLRAAEAARDRYLKLFLRANSLKRDWRVEALSREDDLDQAAETVGTLARITDAVVEYQAQVLWLLRTNAERLMPEGHYTFPDGYTYTTEDLEASS